jgi:predicted N-acetyltransferase YhbS
MLNRKQFSQPRTGYVNEKDASAHIHQIEPGHHYLANLSVHHERRGQGIGTRFMHDLLREHDLAGSRVTLHTARPELVKWYSSMGFEPEREEELGTRMTRRPRESQ